MDVSTPQDREKWAQKGRDQGFDLMIIATDTFDWSDYPIYCMEAERDGQISKISSQNMTRIMEIINLREEPQRQLIPGTDYPIPAECKETARQATFEWKIPTPLAKSVEFMNELYQVCYKSGVLVDWFPADTYDGMGRLRQYDPKFDAFRVITLTLKVDDDIR